MWATVELVNRLFIHRHTSVHWSRGSTHWKCNGISLILFGVSFLLLCFLERGGGPSVLMKLWSTTHAREGARVLLRPLVGSTSEHQCCRVALTLNKTIVEYSVQLCCWFSFEIWDILSFFFCQKW